MKTLAEIQKEVTDWSVRNFGRQLPHRPLLGIIEELCELEESTLPSDLQDAIGDVSIYMLDFCARRGWDLSRIVAEVAPVPDTYVIPIIRGFAHHQLKGEQGIRGGAAVHDPCLQRSLSSAYYYLEEMAATQEIELLEIINKVWAKVRQRDWVAHPDDAASIVEAQEGSA